MQTYRILIVDDDDTHREVLGDYLQRAGFAMEEADNGKKGLNAAREVFPDLILLDLQMPEMDGFSVLQALQSDPLLSDIPVLFLTSHDRTNLKVRAMESGAEDYIVKPFQFAELIARVHAALRRSARYRKREAQLQGNFENISLFELFSTLEIGQKTAHVEFPDISASVYIVEGRFADAAFEGFSGISAWFRIFLIAKGRFEVRFDNRDGTAPVGTENVSALLLETARQMDECVHALEPVARLQDWVELGPQPAEIPLSVLQCLPMSIARFLAVFPAELGEAAKRLRMYLENFALQIVSAPQRQ